MNASDPNQLPIGVFDSGVGGLTVLAALHRQLPAENLIYLGDTARLPYGTKSPASIARYASQATRVLQDRGIKMLVVACNTASAVAMDALRQSRDSFDRSAGTHLRQVETALYQQDRHDEIGRFILTRDPAYQARRQASSPLSEEPGIEEVDSEIDAPPTDP